MCAADRILSVVCNGALEFGLKRTPRVCEEKNGNAHKKMEKYAIMKKDTFANDLDHIYVAYRYCADSIPKAGLFVNNREVLVGSFVFKTRSQAYSMRVELGWAFFTRMDACLETLAHELQVKTGKNGILDFLKKKGYSFSEFEEDGLKVYRELRNTLHHGDGDPAHLNYDPEYLKISSGHEPQITEEQMKNFYELFKKVGNLLIEAKLALPENKDEKHGS